jgi:hypothetical protein
MEVGKEKRIRFVILSAFQLESARPCCEKQRVFPQGKRARARSWLETVLLGPANTSTF